MEPHISFLATIITDASLSRLQPFFFSCSFKHASNSNHKLLVFISFILMYTTRKKSLRVYCCSSPLWPTIKLWLPTNIYLLHITSMSDLGSHVITYYCQMQFWSATGSVAALNPLICRNSKWKIKTLPCTKSRVAPWVRWDLIPKLNCLHWRGPMPHL